MHDHQPIKVEQNNTKVAYQTVYLLLCSFINNIYRTVSLLPGWLPRLALAQTTALSPCGNSLQLLDTQKENVIKINCTTASVQHVGAFLLSASYGSWLHRQNKIDQVAGYQILPEKPQNKEKNYNN